MLNEWNSEGNEETGTMEEEDAPPHLAQALKLVLKQSFVFLTVKAPSETALEVSSWEDTVLYGDPLMHLIVS